jgi:AcrR family transcriptional regulator
MTNAINVLNQRVIAGDEMAAPHTTRTKEEVLKDFRTAEILDAARRVIGELGYADASMERIAQEAGVAKGTLYLYFKNKESLLLAALELGYEELVSRTRSATQRVRGSEEKLRQVAEAFVEHASEHRSFYRALQERPDLGPDALSRVSERMRDLMDGYVELLRGTVERGIRRGELRPVDPRRAAGVFVEILRGVVTARVRTTDPDSVANDVDRVLDLFLHGVSAGERK